jgi:ribosomal protein S18 acetylase RimI-like enzyme
MDRSKSPQVCVRQALPSDRSRIHEISSQIWDGDDYVPELLDSWYADRMGELVVATQDNFVIAFAHRTWLCPGIAWLEGIRSDPAHQGRGAGKAITDYLIEAAQQAGASRITLSTHIDNKASIHIIESRGFRRVSSFAHLERPADALPIQGMDPFLKLCPVTEEDARAYVAHSSFLSLACGWFPRGWRFFPFDHNPSEAVARLRYRTGAWRDGTLVALLCIRQGPEHDGAVTLNFLDGEPAGMRALLARACETYARRRFEIKVPVNEGKAAAAMPLLQETGFTSWLGFEPDVFAYELLL